MTESVDVVVVGAGVGGLAAARALVAGGAGTLVVEARDRIGGRVWSRTVDGAGLDLGATWFWAGEDRVRALIADLGLAVHDQYIRGDALYQDPRGVHRLDGNPVEGPAGRITAGMQELARAMARTLPEGAVRLGRPVTRVRRVPEGVEVAGRDFTVRASAAILALPPALALDRIAFEPDLPYDVRRLAAESPVWMGGMTKVVLRYSSAFWRDSGLAGAVVSHVGPLREIHDMSGPGGEPAALFGFVPPRRPGAPTVRRDEVLTQLEALFGAEATTPLEVHLLDWRLEEWTSPPGVESLEDYGSFGHPLFGRSLLDGLVHWGSTETSPESPGHVEGALAAGARAAAAVLATHRAR